LCTANPSKATSGGGLLQVKSRREWISMSKAIDEMLNSILEEFAVCKQAREELEAKALFRLLNYCPPPSANVPLLGNRLDFR
jgi:hypothetical protein